MLFKEFFGEPWYPMDKLYREMSRMFENFGASTEAGVSFPLVNMWSTENEALVCAELPGVNPQEVDINIHEDILTIQGQRKVAQEKEEKILYHRQERDLGNYRRKLRLPFRVEGDKVEAKYEKGILSIKLPRAEKDKPRQIKVQG